MWSSTDNQSLTATGPGPGPGPCPDPGQGPSPGQGPGPTQAYEGSESAIAPFPDAWKEVIDNLFLLWFFLCGQMVSQVNPSGEEQLPFYCFKAFYNFSRVSFPVLWPIDLMFYIVNDSLLSPCCFLPLHKAVWRVSVTNLWILDNLPNWDLPVEQPCVRRPWQRKGPLSKSMCSNVKVPLLVIACLLRQLCGNLVFQPNQKTEFKKIFKGVNVMFSKKFDSSAKLTYRTLNLHWFCLGLVEV